MYEVDKESHLVEEAEIKNIAPLRRDDGPISLVGGT